MVEAPNKQIFAVIALKNAPALAAKIRDMELTSLSLTDDSWLAVYGGTTREFAEALGIRSGEIGVAGLVVPVENYSGRASSDVWEWLKVNWTANG